MKKVMSVIIFFFLLIIPFNCYAEQCDMERLKKLANNVEVSTEFDSDSTDIGISNLNLITVNGITEELYAMTKDMRVAFVYDDREEDGSIKQYVESEVSNEIQIFSTYCSEKPLRTIKVDFKKYNIFSKMEECKGLQDKLDVCSEYYDGDLSYDKFVKEIEAYNNKGTSNKEKDSKSFLKENLVLIIILSVICISTIVVFVVKRIKASKLD